MWEVDLLQRQIGCSLDAFCKRLRAGRKARTAAAGGAATGLAATGLAAAAGGGMPAAGSAAAAGGV